MRQPLHYAIHACKEMEKGNKRDKHKQTGNENPIQSNI